MNLNEHKQRREEPREAEMRKVRGALSERGVTVSAAQSLESFTSRGYGVLEDKELSLSFYEALFLQSKGVLDVFKGRVKKPLDFRELLHQFEIVDKNAWTRYLVYRDLRSRGYVVRDGFGLGIDFRVYERGEYGKATAPYLVLVLQEGKPVSVKELARVLKNVQGLKKTLALAVVNRRGEVVYYTLSRLTMKEL
jgi:tRNA-intron endonuclease